MQSQHSAIHPSPTVRGDHNVLILFILLAAGDRGFDPLRLATIKPSAVVNQEDGLPW